jgi:hypothetical protein
MQPPYRIWLIVRDDTNLVGNDSAGNFLLSVVAVVGSLQKFELLPDRCPVPSKNLCMLVQLQLNRETTPRQQM